MSRAPRAVDARSVTVRPRLIAAQHRQMEITHARLSTSLSVWLCLSLSMCLSVQQRIALIPLLLKASFVAPSVSTVGVTVTDFAYPAC